MKMKMQPSGLEQGIYFNLPNEAYHADPALSHGGIVHILHHPRDYWDNSPLNPRREFKRSDAMEFGERCHNLLLEPDDFFKKYSVTGMGWKEGRKLIARGEWEKIKESIDMLKEVPEAYAYFKNGMPEVSIVWDDPATGVRLRVRVDYLRTFGGIDYKRAKSIQDNQLGWHIADYGYDIQCWLYSEGIRIIRELLRRGKVKAHGAHDMLWLKKFMDDDQYMFRFIYQRSTRPFVFRIDYFDREIMENARVVTDDGIRIYKEYIQKYGTDKWPPGSPKPKEFSIYNLPRRVFDRGALQP